MNLINHITLTLENNKLTSLSIHPSTITNSLPPHILDELQAYLANPQHQFNVELAPKGTPFQLKVWKALVRIPAGRTMTYGELAKQLGSSPRAIGQACRTNPIPIIVPCHRVVAANGPGGYTGQRSGEMMDVKMWLLKHEAA